MGNKDEQIPKEEHEEDEPCPTVWSHRNKVLLRCILAVVLLYGSLYAYISNDGSSSNEAASTEAEHPRRRLTALKDTVPSYMAALVEDLKSRQKLFDETPPEQIKYWFEYTGPLQKYYYRFSKSREKADYFEGRDDSGVTSMRFTDEFLGGPEYKHLYGGGSAGEAHKSNPGSNQHTMQYRFLENCLAMGSKDRPDTTTEMWKDWYGDKTHPTFGSDRCRVLFTLNTVGAGRGTTMLWETSPPELPYAQAPPRWTSEQETAAMHIQRQLEEIDAMCATNQVAARVQVLVCEPIAAKWTEWMDSLLPHCGGKISYANVVDENTPTVEDRASPVQVVVVATMDSADTCHDLKSGFMERRTQDLILAPPYLNGGSDSGADPGAKTTHPDLVSSDDHDLYVGLKWTSLVTMRALNSFLQASADIAAAASSPNTAVEAAKESNTPVSPFLIPSFVRVSYVSEENAKVAKWRMHGDFFHPAAWEICKDSFELTWLADSLSGPGGVHGLCYEGSSQEATKRRTSESSNDCGQWWVYMTELQMSTSPDVYANEVTPPVVQGGSNFVWMVTERQRRAVVERQVCLYKHKDDEASAKKCPAGPQAVMPLGDLESFLINYTPNSALGRKHLTDRRPGYSRQAERDAERELVKERKQLKGQEDIEKALFDYTVYPAALFRKDATLKAARARDAALASTHDTKDEVLGPKLIKSEYYDVTVTKPRGPVLGWCQAIARRGLCALYSDYFRTSSDLRCLEACGMKKDFTPIRAA